MCTGPESMPSILSGHRKYPIYDGESRHPSNLTGRARFGPGTRPQRGPLGGGPTSGLTESGRRRKGPIHVADLIRHARYFVLQLAESHLTGTLFRQILGRIERLACHPT
jgi:hypothetical protein